MMLLLKLTEFNIYRTQSFYPVPNAILQSYSNQLIKRLSHPAHFLKWKEPAEWLAVNR